MKSEITQKDIDNPQRFVGEGLGAPELRIVGAPQQSLEAKAQDSADYVHGK